MIANGIFSFDDNSLQPAAFCSFIPDLIRQGFFLSIPGFRRAFPRFVGPDSAFIRIDFQIFVWKLTFASDLVQTKPLLHPNLYGQ
ncbi:hypothetical protein BWI97_05405 [Siphonobacter sp. BAB-5405]|nr:hypothetical protein BWI97_05405 [Siphonobacter sp. BAB-5405]